MKLNSPQSFSDLLQTAVSEQKPRCESVLISWQPCNTEILLQSCVYDNWHYFYMIAVSESDKSVNTLLMIHLNCPIELQFPQFLGENQSRNKLHFISNNLYVPWAEQVCLNLLIYNADRETSAVTPIR